MGKQKHKKSYYNDIALRLGHKLFGVEHLHYGYFDGSLPETLDSIPEAQQAYVDNLISYIPDGINRIFDVGCGTGGMASELLKRDYEIVCLAPDPYLIEKTAERTEGKVSRLIVDLYENVEDESDESFDMILMSESCQYIQVERGWKQNQRLLRKGGYVLIGDFFRIRELDPGISKSGHPLQEFIEAGNRHGFELIKEVDITEQVAPTMDIYQDMIKNRVFPVAEAIFEFLERKSRFLYWLGKKALGKKIEKLHVKYSNQGADLFKKYKQYTVLLFQKK